MTAILKRRYDSELKLLNLSSLGNDPELVKMGMFSATSTESKFFPALMKVSDLIFTSPQQKREAVASVTLADNMLSDIKSVTTLSQAFPDLKNLDLSNNQLKDLRSLDGWRWKFRHLDHLVLTGNPIEAEILTYKDEILKWYPTLRILNSIQVRSDEDIAAASKGKLTIPILPLASATKPRLRELHQAVLPHFRYRSQRTSERLLRRTIDFFLSVNTSAPRASEQPVGHEKMKPLAWDAYIKKSRNLIKVTHLPARLSRAYVGTEAIRDLWISLPSTRHPDLLGEPQKWLIECHSLPGLPDPTGQSPGGVGGLIVMVHGEFYEIDEATGQPTMERSFDRTFVIGPGGGVGGIRVVSDILTLRAWGGSAAWVPESAEAIAAPTSAPYNMRKLSIGLE
jgi:nuclear RNA export factor